MNVDGQKLSLYLKRLTGKKLEGTLMADNLMALPVEKEELKPKKRHQNGRIEIQLSQKSCKHIILKLKC